MPKKTIDAVEVTGKRVLIRVDFNVPLDGKTITDDSRIRKAVPTIKNVMERGGMPILMSHLGRPRGQGYEESLSLAPAAQRLSVLVGKPVQFPSQDCVDENASQAVAKMRPGHVMLLENLRFHEEEKKGDVAFAAKLAAYADIYVNEAFGTCHRLDASMVAVPEAMAGKPRVSGFLVQKEIKYLREALADPAHPFVVALGGAKVSDKLGAIGHLLPRADAILIGGAMAYTFCEATGHRMGKSKVERDKVKEAKETVELAAKLKADLHLPVDHVCGTTFNQTGGDIEIFEDHIPDAFIGMDIGPRTQADFTHVLRGAKTIVWNGPMGVFEWMPFRVGTQQVAKAIADATAGGAVSIVGGGDSAAAVEKFGLADRMSHVSTGGGASLEMLEGKMFKSVDLLDEA